MNVEPWPYRGGMGFTITGLVFVVLALASFRIPAVACFWSLLGWVLCWVGRTGGRPSQLSRWAVPIAGVEAVAFFVAAIIVA